MLAHDRLELLRARVAPEILSAASDALAAMAAAGGWTSGPGDALYDEAVAEVVREGSMAAQLVRSYAGLKARITDAGVVERLGALDDRLAIGATSDGAVSAAVFAYDDGSYLFLADQSLMVLTWLVAQLSALLMDAAQFGLEDGPSGVESANAAAAIRLGVARPAVGARAGLVPALTVPEARLAIAGALTNEMDLLLLGHELAHILLGHFVGRRMARGALPGESLIADDALEAEHAADLLAVTFLFDDYADGHSRATAVLRLAAIRLLFTLIELYERACFVLQPASHPAAAARFAYVERVALRPWFGDDLDALLAPVDSLAAALETSEPLMHAVGRVERGLAVYLDRSLWEGRQWAEVAQLASLVNPPLGSARRALVAAVGDDDGAAALVAQVLADQQVTELVASKRGQPLTRLEFLDAVAAALGDKLPTVPIWAVSALAAEALPRLVDP